MPVRRPRNDLQLRQDFELTVRGRLERGDSAPPLSGGVINSGSCLNSESSGHRSAKAGSHSTICRGGVSALERESSCVSIALADIEPSTHTRLRTTAAVRVIVDLMALM